jgi:hypothetical protein
VLVVPVVSIVYLVNLVRGGFLYALDDMLLGFRSGWPGRMNRGSASRSAFLSNSVRCRGCHLFLISKGSIQHRGNVRRHYLVVDQLVDWEFKRL